MAEFAQCPQCGLKHSRRDDGLCPRCQNAVESDAATGPASSALVEQVDVHEPETPPLATFGSRAAGLLLIVNAVLVLALAAVTPSATPFFGVHSVIVDLVVGGGLLTGRARWHKWACVRAILGGVIFGGIFA